MNEWNTTEEEEPHDLNWAVMHYNQDSGGFGCVSQEEVHECM